MRHSFIDLFAGIGGMRLGFEAACKDLGCDSECIFSSESDEKCQDTYEINFGERPDGDISDITQNALHKIKEHDVLMAGFPCQPFSQAGLRMGFEDTRGTLFHDIAIILKERKPKAFLLENVRGLRSHDKGQTLKTILNVLRNDLGYFVPEPKILNSKDFGLPQNRQRIFIIGFLKENNFTFPEPLCLETKVSQILNPGRTPKKYFISQKLWDSHRARRLRNETAIPKKGFGYKSVTAEDKYTSTISARYYKDGAEILIKRKGEDKEVPPRKLTPDEARQLQGFPKHFIINKSNVQAYKQFGNAVSIPVIKEIVKKILINI
jgi:DNA (cytosine-5)-methyltransferase 1